MPHLDEEAGPVELPLGKVVGKRWKVVDKLGEGGCGAVYLVEELKTQARAAMKAESNFVAGGSVLKLEVQVLKRMRGRRLLNSSVQVKKDRYSYMVMTLFGASLSKLFKECRRQFSVSTQIRLGLQILYGLKQLHECFFYVGYIHRDVKPANLAIGRKGGDARMVHLLDFGLAREYVLRSGGKVEIRRPRDNTLFRGTTKYCSANTHTRAEQGRPDDLWSMIYLLAEMRGPLPWDQLRDKHDIGAAKNKTTDEQLLEHSPPELLKITAHLRTLDYFKRPNYKLIFDILLLRATMLSNNIKYSDPFDWEIRGVSVSAGKNKLNKKLSRIATVSEDKSVDVKTMEIPSTDNKDQKTSEEVPLGERPPFTAQDMEKNELGF
ncbi:putative serine/threonine-protein kinase K06H7.1 [Aphelenchoides besseyi]|nr:putative serine/threonine-protein kinase K06H7.1 [Aphelenchoides besseyi]